MESISPSIEGDPKYWWASDLMEFLGYQSWSGYNRLLDAAVMAMINIGIPYYQNVIPSASSKHKFDFKLSRFACYLVVTFADRRTGNVAEVQDRFNMKAAAYGLHLTDVLNLERAEIRHEISEATKHLNHQITIRGVKNYSSFNDAGYQGLYAVHRRDMVERRMLPADSNLLEFMDRTELAANLMRITLTEEEIIKRDLSGQGPLEKAHFTTGQDLRTLIRRNTGLYPEQLPVIAELSEVKTRLKQGYKNLVEDKKVSKEHSTHTVPSPDKTPKKN